MIALLRFVLLLYILALVLVMIMSWFPVAYDSPVAKLNMFLRRITEPMLAPLRRVIPPVGGGTLDLSPTITLFVLLILYQVL